MSNGATVIQMLSGVMANIYQTKLPVMNMIIWRYMDEYEYQTCTTWYILQLQTAGENVKLYGSEESEICSSQAPCFRKGVRGRRLKKY